jgi:metallophosphoesterase superfamily enzyme
MYQRELPLPAPSIEVLRGVRIFFDGLALLEETGSLLAADIHFAYEEMIGGSLPLWSIPETVRILLDAIERVSARELILLGDVVHGSRMSNTAARHVFEALEALRAVCTLTIIAGNHEGRSRGVGVLGPTEEEVERAGWLLVHGDEIVRGKRCIIGHLHPSMHLAGYKSAPAFLTSASLIVLPALTPYSRGLDVCSKQATEALLPWLAPEEALLAFAAAGNMIYPFGSLETLSASRPLSFLGRKKRLGKSQPSQVVRAKSRII